VKNVIECPVEDLSSDIIKSLSFINLSFLNKNNVTCRLIIVIHTIKSLSFITE